MKFSCFVAGQKKWFDQDLGWSGEGPGWVFMAPLYKQAGPWTREVNVDPDNCRRFTSSIGKESSWCTSIVLHSPVLWLPNEQRDSTQVNKWHLQGKLPAKIIQCNLDIM